MADEMLFNNGGDLKRKQREDTRQRMRDYLQTDASEKPAFAVMRPSDRHVIGVYKNGRTEGFPEDHTVLLNRIPLLVDAAWNEGRQEVEARLPWKGATIRFLQCTEGHGRLTADNWVPTDCQTCRIAYLEAVVENMPNADSVKEILATKDAEIDLLRQALGMKDARIAQLKTRLASTPVAFEDPDPEPAPVPGFWNAILAGNKQSIGLLVERGDMPRPIE